MDKCVVLSMAVIVMGQVLLNGKPLCSGDGDTVHQVFTVITGISAGITGQQDRTVANPLIGSDEIL
jgi:hypothetical protein